MMNSLSFRLASIVVVVVVTNLLTSCSSISACSRKPQGATGDRSPVDDSFQIHIDGNPATYIRGQLYNISLSCSGGLKFISFTLALDGDDGTGMGSDYDLLGHFEITDVAETKFSINCENMIENTNANGKQRVDVAWVAPTNPKSGCIFIRAAVLQHRNVWFIDDGFLSKRICPEETDEVNSQMPSISSCCACDEAKYEIILERRWTRNTHPKDFPQELWRTRFSEMVGASHSNEYRFWDYGQPASLGLQEMAEHGSTNILENEIKSGTNSGNIRTIVKAPGIPYRRNVLGTTLATVRVNRNHHLVSLVSKIVPSPDWIVGVAGLELCFANCTWVDEKVLNLYPWDVGTDAGPSYMSPDQPQKPPDVIRRITSTFPSDIRSPFYDRSGAPMKPLALLYISRKKLYERECNDETEEPFECATHPWNGWSECSSKCGSGLQYRTRAYKDQSLAESYGCQLALRQNKRCTGNSCGSPEPNGPPEDSSGRMSLSKAECELSDWGQWSPCSNPCGSGVQKRRREFLNPLAREKCQIGRFINLEERRNCEGRDCGGTISSDTDYNNEFNEQNEYRINDINDRNYVRQNGGQYPLPTENYPIYTEDRAAYGQATGSEIYGTERYIQNRHSQTAGTHDNQFNGGSADSNDYSIVQQYCFEKPHTYRNSCGKISKLRNYWFYDSDDFKCKIFTTNGCDENKNKFGTLRACEGTCLHPHQNQNTLKQKYDDDISEGYSSSFGTRRSNGNLLKVGYKNFYKTETNPIEINEKSQMWGN